MGSQFICKVASVLSPTELVINKGNNSGLKTGMRFLIYTLSVDDIKDPETNESLGKLELVKGTGKIIHLQETMATIESDMFKQPLPKKIIRKNENGWKIFPYVPHETVEEIPAEEPEQLAFKEAEIGDYAKYIP